MRSKIQQFVPVVLVAMLLASAAMLGPAAMAAEGEPYLQIIEGEVLWQESTASDEVVVWVKVGDDLDGDGLPDVLVQTYWADPSGNQTRTVIAKKGSDGTHLLEESVSGSNAYIEAEVVADLDGDGLPDVLALSSVGPDDDATSTVTAKKGSNGSLLWQESISGDYAYIYAKAVSDLNGDGLPDVLVDSYLGPEDNSTGTVIAKLGFNGTHLWEESISGYGAGIWGEEEVGDLDGDGLPDVVVYMVTGPSHNLTVTLIAKVGINGTHLWEESITGDEASIWVEVVGDLDGDGLPDALVGSNAGPSNNVTYNLTAKKGSNGNHLWEQSISGEDAEMAADVVGDLDGDSLPDVMVRSEVGPDGSVTYNLTAKKGSNGSHLWEESVSSSYVSVYTEVVGDLEGDGLPDVLIEWYVGHTDTETLVAKKGSDGTDLWEESAPSGYYNFIEGKVVGDQDGDGLTDVLVRIYTGPLNNTTATVVAKKGSDGTHMWEESISGYNAGLNDDVVPDLDGDGLPDVIIRMSLSGGTPEYTLIAKKISDGTHLWEESNTESGPYMEAWVVADLDGDGLTDVLVQTEQGFGGDRTFTWIAKKGSDGTHLWEESVSGDRDYNDIEAEGVAADFDGDGLPDILVQSRTGSAESQTYTAIGKRGSDGTHLWEVESNEEISFPRLQEGDGEPLFLDLNGDGKADAFVWISNQVCAVAVGGEEAPTPSVPGAVPSVTRWGTIGMIAVFSLLLALMVRRRLAADSSTERWMKVASQRLLR